MVTSQDSARTRSRPWGCEARSGLAPIQRGRLTRPWLTYRMEATPGPTALEARRGGVQLGISRSGRDCGSPCRFSCHQPGGSRSPLGTLSAAGPDHSPLACPAATASPGSLYASTKPVPARSPGGRNPRSRARARPASRPRRLPPVLGIPRLVPGDLLAPSRCPASVCTCVPTFLLLQGPRSFSIRAV